MAKTTETKRLKILEVEEIEVMYSLPVFDEEERALYFTLSSLEKSILTQFLGVKSLIYCILQLGYFKAKQQFYRFDLQQVSDDATYVQQTYFPGVVVTDLNIAKATRLKQQTAILELLNYRYCSKSDRQELQDKAQQLAQISGQPVYIFRELVNFLGKQNLIVPGYSTMQKIIGNALQQEQERLITIAKAHLNDNVIKSLNNLLANPRGLYEITRLKREPKDFGEKEINKEIKRGEQIEPLYEIAQTILEKLDISNESIKYYASLVNYYSVFQLSQLEERVAHIYLLCFVYHRYQKIHDNLINCLIYRTRKLRDEAKNDAKVRVYTYRLEHNRNLYKAGKVLKLFGTDEDRDEDVLFEDVQSKAFAILPEAELESMANHLMKVAKLDEVLFQWEYIDQIALRMKRRLRPILRAVDFQATKANRALLTAVDFLQTAIQKGPALTQYQLDDFPMGFVSRKHKRYLYTTNTAGEKQLLVDRYEFLVYRLLYNNLESGDLFCQDSVRFRSFEDDLLSDEQWQDKDVLMAKTGLPILTQSFADHLAELKESLETQLTEVNERIIAGENKHIEVKKSGRWHLPYVRASDDVNDPFFDSLPQVDIQAVCQFVNEHCGFMTEFTHVLHRHAGRRADERTLIACLIAWGTNMGLWRMGQISDIDFHTLATISDNFIRLETLKKANDVVTNAIANLPIFKHYHIGDTIHSSSDGQKFETRIHTINARYSRKYFGLMKGVVAYTLVANHIPLSTKMIGANEHESPYVFDLLHNNQTEIKPTIHSTDTHGTNEVNFGILNFFGYQFAPRYHDIYDKVSTSLYGFKHPSQYPDNWILKPIRKINENLISSEKDNIKRIMTSLALKTTTQSIIIGKLSSHARKNKTKRALWEYDNIILSRYLLTYVDSLTFRQHIQKAVNRGESYHKLHKAVSFANFGKLRFKTEGEQQIWNECGRLLANCIIFYNAMILSNVLHHQRSNGSSDISLEQISPVAWQHVNFYGRYEFTKSLQPIDIDAIVRALVSPQ